MLDYKAQVSSCGENNAKREVMGEVGFRFCLPGTHLSNDTVGSRKERHHSFQRLVHTHVISVYESAIQYLDGESKYLILQSLF